MPAVIRNQGDPNHCKTLNGTWVNREHEIYLPSHHRVYPVLNTSMHFCYREPNSEHRYSSTIFCTCGSPAGVFNYPAYMKYQSKNEGEVIACINFIQYGLHSDNSHE